MFRIILLIALLVTLLAVLAVVQLATLLGYAGKNAEMQRKENRKNGAPIKIGFFHPSCACGGGGERVLWTAVRCMLEKWPTARGLIYVRADGGAAIDRSALLETVAGQFQIPLDGVADRLEFVGLSSCSWMDASGYPRLTLLLQSLGACVPAFQALTAALPDVFVDTVGAAFAYPLAKLVFGCRVVAYTHYPAVSGNMLARVERREAGLVNNQKIAQSAVLSAAKAAYYRMFARAYGWAGRCAQVAMANSTWTRDALCEVWRVEPATLQIVYPPCDVGAAAALPLDGPSGKERQGAISVAQFRPEKNHELQLEVAAEWARRHAEHTPLTLTLVGGCRNAADEARVAQLRATADRLGLKGTSAVRFLVNAPYPELLRELGAAAVGLHTMRDEHFGIGIVECMAAGAVAIAHNSGGPRSDILAAPSDKPVGYLATTVGEYVDALEQILLVSPPEKVHRLRAAARQRVRDRFSDEAFCAAWLAAVSDAIDVA